MIETTNPPTDIRFLEPYMTTDQLDYFKNRLLDWRSELAADHRISLTKINEPDSRPIEEMERSAQAVDREIEISTQIRIRQLICRIDEALNRISSGTFGYCEETDEPIGIERLKASPVAAYCLTVQEQIEQNEKKRRFGIF